MKDYVVAALERLGIIALLILVCCVFAGAFLFVTWVLSLVPFVFGLNLFEFFGVCLIVVLLGYLIVEGSRLFIESVKSDVHIKRIRREYHEES